MRIKSTFLVAAMLLFAGCSHFLQQGQVQAPCLADPAMARLEDMGGAERAAELARLLDPGKKQWECGDAITALVLAGGKEVSVTTCEMVLKRTEGLALEQCPGTGRLREGLAHLVEARREAERLGSLRLEMSKLIKALDRFHRERGEELSMCAECKAKVARILAEKKALQEQIEKIKDIERILEERQ